MHKFLFLTVLLALSCCFCPIQANLPISAPISLSYPKSTINLQQVYTVQIGAYKKVNLQQFKDLWPIGYVHTLPPVAGSSLTRVQVGLFLTHAKAREAQRALVSKGYTDAGIRVRHLSPKDEVKVIHLTTFNGRVPLHDFSALENFGDLYVHPMGQGQFLHLIVGIYSNTDKAMEVLNEVKTMGYANATLVTINKKLLLHATYIEHDFMVLNDLDPTPSGNKIVTIVRAEEPETLNKNPKPQLAEKPVPEMVQTSINPNTPTPIFSDMPIKPIVTDPSLPIVPPTDWQTVDWETASEDRPKGTPAILPAPTKNELSFQQAKHTSIDFVKNSNQQVLGLYSVLSGGEENVFLSPFSISASLAMSYAPSGQGSGFATDEQLKGMYFNNENMIDIFAQNPDLGTYFHSFNALWADDELNANQETLLNIGECFDAEVRTLNFSRKRKQALESINEWAADVTQNRMGALIKDAEINPDAQLLLTNILFFKGDWEHQFDPFETREGIFFTDGNGEVKAEFMSIENQEYGYFENQAFQILELPYAGNEQSMLIFLPQEPLSLNSAEKHLSLSNYEEWTANLQPHNVKGILPKFSLSFSTKLSNFKWNETTGKVQQYGEYDEATSTTQIDDILHRTFIEIDEQGRLVKAPNFSNILPIAKKPPVQFMANRSFLFIIRDNATNAVLFVGRVHKPV